MKGQQDSFEQEEGSQTAAMEVETRGIRHYYTDSAASELESDDDDVFPSKNLFDSMFEQAWKEEHPKRAALPFNSVASKGRDHDFTYPEPEDGYDAKSWTALWDWYTEYSAEKARKNGEQILPNASGAISPANENGWNTPISLENN